MTDFQKNVNDQIRRDIEKIAAHNGTTPEELLQIATEGLNKIRSPGFALGYRAALEAAAVVPAMVAPGHWLVSDVDRIHDAILALPVPSLRDTLTAMVQPLEWWGDKSYQRARVFGWVGYEVYRFPTGKWVAEVLDLIGGRQIAKCDTEEAAKAAAQADYTRRILAALGVKE